jgi:Response regulators consisting of a CheY-like receiver domain and a winged-helix DNA-binding domain
MQQSYKILMLEDDPNLGFILQEHLEMNGFNVKLCINGVEGLTEYGKDKFSLCLVDVMMPKKNGFAFVKELRAKDAFIPVIFLTAKSLKEDRIEGFKLGCDDYITKPFSMEELLLRINAVLRRSSAASINAAQSCFNINSYLFDYDKQSLQKDDIKVQLTTKEAELLRLLCLHKNKILEREVALNLIWGSDNYFNARSMDVFISKIRKYLKDDPAISIVNVHSKGYKLTTEN